MDSFHIRCKDLKPNNPHAFKQLRETEASPVSNSAVTAWINDLALPHPHSAGRRPLRPTQPRRLKYSKSIRSCAAQSQPYSQAHCVRRPMADNNSQSPAKRERGRTRGSVARGRRGRVAERSRGAAELVGTDKSKAPSDQENILKDGNSLASVSAAPALHPPPSLSLPSRTSSTRSPTRSKAPSAVVKKGQLASMTPAIRFISHDMAAERGGLPPLVEDLWANHLFPTLNRSDFIPPGLRDRLTALFDTPRKSKLGLKPDLFDSVDIFNESDLELIWTTLTDVYRMAGQYRNTAPESHWIGTVVAPLLHLVRRLNLFQKAGDGNRALLEVLDVTTTEISPQSLCPYSDDPSLFKDLDKRVDYAIGLRLSAQERDLLERGQFAETYPTSINQTSNFANFTPLFVNIEVKRRHVDKDPMIQLAAWIAAEFNKRKVEGYSLDMPVFAIGVDGDLWELHVAYSESPLAADDYRLNFLGIFDMGNTKTYQGMFQIVYILCCLVRWGLGEYREWVNREILNKYGRLSGPGSL